jgi:hypothetical protein
MLQILVCSSLYGELYGGLYDAVVNLHGNEIRCRFALYAPPIPQYHDTPHQSTGVTMRFSALLTTPTLS